MSKRNNIVEAHYRENFDKLVKVAARRVPNNSLALAEEAVQESYTKACKYFRTFDPGQSSFATWHSKILRNCINQLRTLESAASFKEFDDEKSVSANEVDRKWLTWIVNHINKSDEEEYTILMMFYYHGFKSIEIAEFLNKKHTTIRQIIHRWKIRSGFNELVQTIR